MQGHMLVSVLVLYAFCHPLVHLPVISNRAGFFIIFLQTLHELMSGRSGWGFQTGKFCQITRVMALN